MQGSRALFRIWIIWKIGAKILYKRKIVEKDVSRAHVSCFILWILRGIFLCTDILHRWWLLKVKKRINKALFLRLNLNSLYYFFIFWFKRLRSEDPQQIYCRAEVLHNFFWNHISVWVYSCKFAAYLEDPIFKRS